MTTPSCPAAVALVLDAAAAFEAACLDARAQGFTVHVSCHSPPRSMIDVVPPMLRLRIDAPIEG